MPKRYKLLWAMFYMVCASAVLRVVAFFIPTKLEVELITKLPMSIQNIILQFVYPQFQLFDKVSIGGINVAVSFSGSMLLTGFVIYEMWVMINDYMSKTSAPKFKYLIFAMVAFRFEILPSAILGILYGTFVYKNKPKNTDARAIWNAHLVGLIPILYIAFFTAMFTLVAPNSYGIPSWIFTHAKIIISPVYIVSFFGYTNQAFIIYLLMQAGLIYWMYDQILKARKTRKRPGFLFLVAGIIVAGLSFPATIAMVLLYFNNDPRKQKTPENKIYK